MSAPCARAPTITLPDPACSAGSSKPPGAELSLGSVKATSGKGVSIQTPRGSSSEQRVKPSGG